MSRENAVLSGKGLLFSVWLAECISGCPGEYRELISRYGSAEGVYNAEFVDENGGEAVKKSLVRALNDKNLEKAERILNYCLSERISVITPDSSGYPTLLKELRDPPAVLYLRGSLPDLLNIPATAVVGTRRMTKYGMQVAYNMGYGLTVGGSVVVSGMAAGGDSLALCGALDAGGAPIAVLGCSVDRAYPAGNARLMEEIAERGAVISEYSPGSEIYRQNFPQRNRIISGLSRIIAVTEAGDPSGALITAQTAIMQGKTVFAVPGTVGLEGSVGVNDLLKNGASVLTCPEDILKEYAFLYSNIIKLGSIETKSSEQAGYSAAIHRVDMGAFKKELAIAPAVNIPLKTNGSIGTTAGIKQEKNDINITKTPCVKVKNEEELSALDSKTKEIYLSLPEKDFSPDDVVNEKYGIGDVMCALTVLEINSLISALPGGRYGKNR